MKADPTLCEICRDPAIVLLECPGCYEHAELRYESVRKLIEAGKKYNALLH